MSKFHVSVAMITYNQAPYIAKAMESVLRQKTDFDIEVIVGDDASKDKTAEILKQFEKDKRVRLQLRTKNLGANGNFTEVFRACTGKYVAILEGDDFWVDDSRLQKQVDFMERHPDCAVVGSRARIERDGVAVGSIPSDEHLALVKEKATGEDFLKLHYIHTSAILYRNVLRGELPPNYSSVLYGDRLLVLLHARHGWIGFIPDTVSVYRQVAQGILVSRSDIDRAKADVGFYENVGQFFGKDYSAAINAEKVGYRIHLIQLLVDAGRFEEARAQLGKLWKDDRSGIALGRFANLNFRVLFPKVFSTTKALKRAVLG